MWYDVSLTSGRNDRQEAGMWGNSARYQWLVTTDRNCAKISRNAFRDNDKKGTLPLRFVLPPVTSG